MGRPSRVAFTGLGGGYVEQALAPAEGILPLPANLSAINAVTLGSSGMVAHFGLAHALFAPGDARAVAVGKHMRRRET